MVTYQALPMFCSSRRILRFKAANASKACYCPSLYDTYQTSGCGSLHVHMMYILGTCQPSTLIDSRGLREFVAVQAHKQVITARPHGLAVQNFYYASSPAVLETLAESGSS